MNDFYVGYLPKAPSLLARFVRRVVGALTLLAVAVALLLLAGQGPFAKSTFEFGKLRVFDGVIEMGPYPALLVERPGETSQTDRYSRYLLVGPGKHGADGLVAGLEGRHVRLRGQLIYRSGGTMIEIEPGSIKTMDTELGTVTLEGEIVDSKCYLGVMNPGQGKVHRDCAARCLSGGIPPLFINSKTGEPLVLTDPEGRPFGRDALRGFVAEPTTVRGKLFEKGGIRQLRIDFSSLQRALRAAATAHSAAAR